MISDEYEQHLQQVANAMADEAAAKEEADAASQERARKRAEEHKARPQSTRSSYRIGPRFIINESAGEDSDVSTFVRQPAPGRVGTGLEIYSLRFSPEGDLIAAAFADGVVKVYASLTGKEKAAPIHTGGPEHLPCMQVRWRPHLATSSKTRNVVVTVNAQGKIQQWHAASSKLLSEVWSPEEQFYCMDYTKDATTFAAAGKLKQISVYDEETRQLKQVMKGGDYTTAVGHSLRVFALKFHPQDSNVIVTGGWDQTVQLWDCRLSRAVRSIHGPDIQGDAVDISEDGKTILTGSHRSKEALELWDVGSLKRTDLIEWMKPDGTPADEGCPLYSAQFSKDPQSRLIAAGGGSGGMPGEAQFFDRTCFNVAFGLITGMAKGCFTVDFSPDNSAIATAGADSTVRVLQIY
ncbi:unnamed protein product [Vitrella brassicaformis CCMP3155]|uniref:Anaphase-promoting complex subunit 4 WD40 domain-containing protein n=2 Tax=Vitrella brassicaformis TaxID=1169539 RepID=A0A0G4EU85_VITBC|nr:unnamed protein product [Vitrella brassicaformis CCMP3155]|eukprot:CEM01842.1 unnamed protein product [Vitrella brassicaformis CCMP3155]